MKMILKKVVGKQILRNDEFFTLLYEAAAFLNSRPLAPLDSLPPDGVSLLTPGHFTIGGPPAALPSESIVPLQVTYGKRWKLLQHMIIDLW